MEPWVLDHINLALNIIIVVALLWVNKKISGSINELQKIVSDIAEKVVK